MGEDSFSPTPPPGVGLPPLREIIAEHGLHARKALGQHFLLDLNLTGRIARAAGDLTTGTVLEIGPGPGGLTRAVLEAGARRVVAIEHDPRCLAALAEIAAAWPDRLIVVAADALTINLADLGEAPRHIVANLPYNIATALLLRWLRMLAGLSAMTVMFQKEVAERLSAPPRCKAYGRLSVMTQWLCTVRALFDVSPRAFTPPPRVTSTVVRLEPRPVPLAPASWPALETVTAAAFGQRRKMLRQSLKRLGNAETLCAAAGLSPTARADEIEVAGFCALARAWETESRGGEAPPRFLFTNGVPP
ncbi:MAG: 16S rRNA (adenine1518-N6/adenine1519-N6)-dimethyltransferase [Rhodospirillaceae bacterium]|nr:MAG: 16S rRNA (adenine1518-N6/adenine1519-N6)-dimethyltransferase [Rhodospirillaceae bacterium]